jgi:RND family efflux transporter MFP subunit
VFGIDDDEIARIDQEEGRERMVYAIKSPCSGTIAEKNVTLGELVDSTVNLFTIADTGTLWVWGDVYERDWRRVQVGQKLSVALSAFPDDPVDSAIDFVSPALDPSSRSIRIRGVLDNRAGRFLADMSATLLVTVDEGRGALIAPTEAVVHEGKGEYVLVRSGRGEDGAATRYRKQAVKVEPLGPDRVRIVDGLAPGSVIVQRNVLGLFQEMHE